MEGKKANGEIEMHGINFRHRTRTLQRDLIKDALRFISEVEWSPSSARTCPPLLDYIHPSTSASCSLFIRPNKPTKFAHSCSNVNWTFPDASFTANLSAKLFYRVSLPVIITWIFRCQGREIFFRRAYCINEWFDRKAENFAVRYWRKFVRGWFIELCKESHIAV